MMATIVEKHTVIHTDEGTTYRLRPNPDVDSGYSAGAVLEWSDDGGKTWTGYFFIAPEAMAAIGKALVEASVVVNVEEIG